jgi:hypothetical protein
VAADNARMTFPCNRRSAALIFPRLKNFPNSIEPTPEMTKMRMLPMTELTDGSSEKFFTIGPELRKVRFGSSLNA